MLRNRIEGELRHDDPSRPAKRLFEELREHGILVRYFAQPRIDNYLRVSIGTDEEMKQFIDAVRKIGGVI
ncbi:hypothetical protein J27TS7_23030 [Paenibacillus dendritiformis]|nr:hypothetical protein J27TS7_23030 [Paenibacillus dendritiformis]